MKNSKKKLVSRAGFTLVELVVTIAVLAILAGVGASAYGGYIDKAKEAKDLAKLANVVTAAQSAGASTTTMKPITGITVSKDGNVTFTGYDKTTDKDLYNAFNLLYGCEGANIGALEGKTFATNGAKWSSTDITNPNKWVENTP